MEPATRPSMLRFGPYIVDLRAGELRKNGSRIRLQEKPLRLLAALAEQQGQMVTREELKRKLWPDDTFVDFETGLNTAVSKLREALSDHSEKPRYVETIPRRGYRFLVSVEFVDGHRPGTENLEPSAPPPPAPLPGVTALAGSLAVEPREAPRAKSGSRAGLWISLVIAVAIVTGGAYWLMSGHPALSFRSRDSVLIADFENQTGDPRFDNALGTAFAVSIEQSRYANVFPRTRVDSVLALMEKPPDERITPELGREICERENIRGLILSSITRAGREYQLTAQLIDPRNGETVRSYTERSYGEDHILEALDVLSKEIREALGESLYEIHAADKPLPQVTTSSLSALQQYAEGSALWREGKFQDAVTLFKAAVAADPGFAVAHAALGNAYYSFIFNAPEEGHEEYEMALSLSSRVTDRERMIIQTNYASNRGYVGEADEDFRAYLSRYPDDSTMRFDYANLLRKNGHKTEAIEQYKQVLRVAPDFASAYIGMATAYKTLGDFPAALQWYSKAFEIDPHRLNTGNVNREYGFTLVANGEDQKAEQVFSAQLVNPQTRENGLRSLAFLDLYHGRYASAQGRLQQSLELLNAQNLPLSVARVHLLLAIVAEGEGDARRQRQNLDAALASFKHIQQKVVFGAMLGDAFSRAGYPGQAEKIATIVAPIADPHSPEQTGYLHLLEGEIALSKGDHDSAIQLLEQSDKEYTTGLSQEALPNAYQQSGNIGKAIATFEHMFSFRDSSLGWEPQQRWIEARYTLAMDYSSRGDTKKARDTLEVLLSLWKDADPNLPLIKRAKAEYAELR